MDFPDTTLDIVMRMHNHLVMHSCSEERSDLLDAVFFALADPTRRAILERLASGPATVKGLAEPFDMSQPAISKHLKVLERARLVERTKVARARPASLNAEPMALAAEWLSEYRQFWEESFDRLDDLLAELTTNNVNE